MSFENSLADNSVKFAKPVTTPSILRGSRFSNPESFSSWTGVPSFTSIFQWKFTEEDDSALPPDEVLEETLPVRKPTFPDSSRLSLTWLGHSTVLTRLDGVTFITDPVWAKAASPFGRFQGPRRYRPPPCSIIDLPQLDFAVISHNHYDHLDVDAVRSISSQSINCDMKWFVPIGLREELIGCGVPADSVFELSWGESVPIAFRGKQFEIFCVPAQHWSQRYLADRNMTLWSGWIVVGPTRRFYFVGDTGFCSEEFEKIGEKFGHIDLSAIPIGCYAPRWFMKSQHINPEEAVQIHLKTRSKKSIAIHWGTYAMGSNEGYLEPPALLEHEVSKAKLKSSAFTALCHGESWVEDAFQKAGDQERLGASDQERPSDQERSEIVLGAGAASVGVSRWPPLGSPLISEL